MGDRSVDLPRSWRGGQFNIRLSGKPSNSSVLSTSYTMVAIPLSSLDVFLEGSHQKEAGTSLYWKTKANHAERRTSTEHPITPIDI